MIVPARRRERVGKTELIQSTGCRNAVVAKSWQRRSWQAGGAACMTSIAATRSTSFSSKPARPSSRSPLTCRWQRAAHRESTLQACCAPATTAPLEAGGLTPTPSAAHPPRQGGVPLTALLRETSLGGAPHWAAPARIVLGNRVSSLTPFRLSLHLCNRCHLARQVRCWPPAKKM